MRAVLSRVERQLEPTILHDDLCTLRGLAPEDIRWRVMDHCSAVGRIYAVYEHFCENVLHDWLHFLSARKPFLDLPEQIVGSYRTGFAHIVSRLPSPRYDHLSVEDLVSGYDAALKGESTYSLAPECLTHHQSNLRWNGPVALLCRPKCSFRPLSSRMRQGFSSQVLSDVVADCRTRLCIRRSPSLLSAASPKDAARSVQL
ncbi:hypothetical protein DSM107133_02982 [Pseudosulfitobacter sp. DSM 107133]|nr:hypothetical protein DSM107133_02982 [Pseudosulfitobacter sp. DSM 107133]